MLSETCSGVNYLVTVLEYLFAYYFVVFIVCHFFLKINFISHNSRKQVRIVRYKLTHNKKIALLLLRLSQSFFLQMGVYISQLFL